MRLRSFKTPSSPLPLFVATEPLPRKPTALSPTPLSVSFATTPVNFARGISTLINRYLSARFLRTFISPCSKAFSFLAFRRTLNQPPILLLPLLLLLLLFRGSGLLCEINLTNPFLFLFSPPSFPPDFFSFDLVRPFEIKKKKSRDTFFFFLEIWTSLLRD